MAKKTASPAQPEYDGEQLPDELLRAQATSDDVLPAPRVAKLIASPADDNGRDAPPVPPVALATPAPRFIHQNERAPKGLVRVKIRCVNIGEQPTRYVLAASEQQAREHYLRATGIKALVAAIGEAAPEPRLSVRTLAD